MKKISVLLIENNRLLREGIAAQLGQQDDFEVIAPAGDRHVFEDLKAQPLKPDVVLLGLGLQKESSLQLMARIGNEVPGVQFIAMDLQPTQSDLFEFIRSGGSGFILKDATIDDFVVTIRKVIAGIKVLPAVLTNSLFDQIEHFSLDSANINIQQSMRLTKREREIIDLISEGLSNKEIAQQLHIAIYTVKSHVHNILEKLALTTRLQIAAFAHTQRSPRTIAADMFPKCH